MPIDSRASRSNVCRSAVDTGSVLRCFDESVVLPAYRCVDSDRGVCSSVRGESGSIAKTCARNVPSNAKWTQEPNTHARPSHLAGKPALQKHEIAVKLYAAVSDRQVHFHMLHNARSDSSPAAHGGYRKPRKPVSPDDAPQGILKPSPALFIAADSGRDRSDVPQASPGSPGQSVRARAG